MRRFDSSLLKIHRLCEQQRQMAGLDVMRAQLAEEHAAQKLKLAEQRLTFARQSVSRYLTRSGTQTVSITVLHGARSAVMQAIESVNEREERLIECHELVAALRKEYLRLQRKSESIEQLLNKERASHHKSNLKQQQLEMDDQFLFRRSTQLPVVAKVNDHE